MKLGERKIVAIIPAKGKSDRFPDKNIFPVNGKPMFYWAVQACKDSKYSIEVWVSSEDERVWKLAEEAGVRVHKRDVSLSQPDVFKMVVIRDAASCILDESGPIDIIISLQANSPEIKGYHLDLGINTLIRYNRSEVFSVDSNLMQNGAFRIMKRDYVFQCDLSTYCGVVVCDVKDIHYKEDLKDIKI